MTAFDPDRTGAIAEQFRAPGRHAAPPMPPPGPDSYGPPPADPEAVQTWLADNDLLEAMRLRGLVVPRRPWFRRERPSVPQQVAQDPEAVLRRIAALSAPLVADRLRATGQAVPVPVHQRSIRDRLADTSPRGAAFLGAASAVLLVAAVVLMVLGAT